VTVTRLSDHLIGGTHASRPAANAVPVATLYSCSDHSLIYQSDGSAWSTYADLTAAGAVALDDLSDVALSAPSGGDALIYTGSGWENVPLPVAALDDLSDVATTGAATDDVLTYNGTSWAPAAPSGVGGALDDLSDVATAGATTSDVLTYNGTSWAPAAPSGGGGGATGIDDLATFEAEWGSTPLITDLEFDGSTTSLPSGWSWVNPGDSGYEEFADYGYLYAASTGGTTGGNDTHRMLVHAIPSASAFRAFFSVPDMQGEAVAWLRWAIVLRESSSGKYLIFGPGTDVPDAWGIHLSEWSALNTFGANIAVKGASPAGIRYVQVRKVSATNWAFYTSRNGRVWTPWYGGYDPASFGGGAVTFDEIGMFFGVSDSSFTYGADVELGFFRIR